MGLATHDMVPPNVCAEQLYLLDIEPYQFTFFCKIDVILRICKVNIF